MNSRKSETAAGSLLARLGGLLHSQKVEGYLVGGWVRDVLLGRDTADIDIAVAADGLEIARKVASDLGGTPVLLDAENSVARVVLPSYAEATEDEPEQGADFPRQLDFSRFEGTIEEDLARRDFTINAMAINLQEFNETSSSTRMLKKPSSVTSPLEYEGQDGEGRLKIPLNLPLRKGEERRWIPLQHPAMQIIDPFHGRDDLERRVVRAVSETVFISDAVRLLRAARLAAELDFAIDETTESLIRRYSHLISGVAGERVREELLRLLAVPGGQFLSYMDELGLLVAIFPEMAETKGVNQPREHYWDVFEHSLRTVSAVDYLLRRSGWEWGGKEALAAVHWSPALEEHFDREVNSGSTRRSLLKLAALLHDVNKPQTKAIDETGRTRFLGHAIQGAATVVQILERLRFSSKETKLVETEVLYHLRPTQMSQAGMPTNRAIYRYFRDAGEAGIDILFLSLADHLASRGPELNLDGWREHASQAGYVISKYFEQEQVIAPPKLVDGYDIINIFRIPAGKEIGELLEAVREAQASGEVTTREEALSLIERLKNKHA